MKIIYMGTPDFAVPTLEAIAKAGHEILYAVTQPDAVRGRGNKKLFPPVKQKSIELGIEVLQPERVRKNDEFLSAIEEAQPDLIVVAAYGQILPKRLLEIPKLGCVNVHGSLLPRFRGAAPIQAAIIEGDEQTGITLMYMEKGLDKGPMLAKASTPTGHKNGQQLHDELAHMGAELLVGILPKLGEIEPEKQDDSLSTYAPMISKSDGHIDFNVDPRRIERTIRAFDPWPGTYAYAGDMMLKFWEAEAVCCGADYSKEDDEKPADRKSGYSEPGTVLSASGGCLDIACKGGILRVTQIQAPGRRRVSVREYLKGNSIEIGTVLR